MRLCARTYMDRQLAEEALCPHAYAYVLRQVQVSVTITRTFCLSLLGDSGGGGDSSGRLQFFILERARESGALNYGFHGIDRIRYVCTVCVCVYALVRVRSLDAALKSEMGSWE